MSDVTFISLEELNKIYEKNGFPEGDNRVRKSLVECMNLVAQRLYVATVTQLNTQHEKHVADVEHLTKSVTELFSICMALDQKTARPSTPTPRARVCYCGARVASDKCEVCGRE